MTNEKSPGPVAAGGVAAAPAGMLENRGRELGRQADEVGERLSHAVREKAHELDATRQHLQARAGETKDRVRDGLADGRARVVSEVQTNPVRSLLWAAGIGVLAGLLVARRMRK